MYRQSNIYIYNEFLDKNNCVGSLEIIGSVW